MAIVIFRTVYLIYKLPNSATIAFVRVKGYSAIRLFEVALKYYYITMLSACFKAKNLHCVVEQVTL